MLFLITSFVLISLTMAIGVTYTASIYIEKVFEDS